ncbi:hypothetical protein C1D09_026855 [Mesorhizobium intechi]|uniref:NADP-dependent oxidoreductase domain-containing protein n=1 Tax=Mesorhizobium intechi TaxID=537601 RepID=A0A8T9AIR1_9HYPH|nr:hypothetical protein C1D09_026855 [Mesorhizobium intechi]
MTRSRFSAWTCKVAGAKRWRSPVPCHRHSFERKSSWNRSSRRALRFRASSDATLAGLGRKHGCSAAQMAIAWLLDQAGVIVTPKAARPESQKSNLDALGIRLDDEDRATIAALPKDQRFVRPPFAPDWDAAA